MHEQKTGQFQHRMVNVCCWKGKGQTLTFDSTPVNFCSSAIQPTAPWLSHYPSLQQWDFPLPFAICLRYPRLINEHFLSSWLFCHHNRLCEDRCVQVWEIFLEIFIVLDQSHMFYGLIVSLFCKCVCVCLCVCVYDRLVSPRCRLLKWAELSRGQWSRGLTA